MADDAASQLEVYAKSGLPSCYKGKSPKARFQSMLFDWYPDLPWEKDGLIIAMQHVLNKHGKTLDLVQSVFKFNMREDLQKGIKEAQTL